MRFAINFPVGPRRKLPGRACSQHGGYRAHSQVMQCGDASDSLAVRTSKPPATSPEAERPSGVTSMRGIARALAVRGIKIARGGDWSDVQVAAILRR